MDLGLRGKTALLLGASRGIGGATALALAAEGARLLLVARDEKRLEERAALCRQAGAQEVIALAADVLDPEQLARAVERTSEAFGALDVLVTFVGGSQPGGTGTLDDGQWESAFDKNLWPAVRASRLCLPLLQKGAARSAEGPSVMLHVASIWGREGGGPLSYNVAKAALISLAHAQARELAPQGIRVLSVAPGSTLHPGGSWERRLQQDPAGTAAFVQRELPFGRFGTAQELGEVIAFLCSPRASWVAGTCVVVDGGQSRSF